MKKPDSVEFKKWLRNRRTRAFQGGEEGCPLHCWLGGEALDQDRLNKLPAWCNRFAAAWDQQTEGCDGNTALRILDRHC